MGIIVGEAAKKETESRGGRFPSMDRVPPPLGPPQPREHFQDIILPLRAAIEAAMSELTKAGVVAITLGTMFTKACEIIAKKYQSVGCTTRMIRMDHPGNGLWHEESIRRGAIPDQASFFVNTHFKRLVQDKRYLHTNPHVRHITALWPDTPLPLKVVDPDTGQEVIIPLKDVFGGTDARPWFLSVFWSVWFDFAQKNPEYFPPGVPIDVYGWVDQPDRDTYMQKGIAGPYAIPAMRQFTFNESREVDVVDFTPDEVYQRTGCPMNNNTEADYELVGWAYQCVKQRKTAVIESTDGDMSLQAQTVMARMAAVVGSVRMAGVEILVDRAPYSTDVMSIEFTKAFEAILPFCVPLPPNNQNTPYAPELASLKKQPVLGYHPAGYSSEPEVYETMKQLGFYSHPTFVRMVLRIIFYGNDNTLPWMMHLWLKMYNELPRLPGSNEVDPVAEAAFYKDYTQGTSFPALCHDIHSDYLWKAFEHGDRDTKRPYDLVYIPLMDSASYDSQIPLIFPLRSWHRMYAHARSLNETAMIGKKPTVHMERWGKTKKEHLNVLFRHAFWSCGNYANQYITTTPPEYCIASGLEVDPVTGLSIYGLMLNDHQKPVICHNVNLSDKVICTHPSLHFALNRRFNDPDRAAQSVYNLPLNPVFWGCIQLACMEKIRQDRVNLAIDSGSETEEPESFKRNQGQMSDDEESREAPHSPKRRSPSPTEQLN